MTIPARFSATIPVTFTSLSPLHHGAGVSGNTQILRTQPAINPNTGEEFVSPIISGNSVRHAIRDALAEATLTRLGAQPGTLSKALVDLLYSGGALTGGGDASNVDIAGHRNLDTLWPAAGLLGYAGRGQIWSGSLYAQILLPVCRENAWRMPHHPHLREHPMAQVSVNTLREEDFGTRHDVTGTHADRWVGLDMWGAGTNQMIYDWQVMKAGTIWYGTLQLAAATPQHAAALKTAWDLLTADGTMHLGAKRAQGYGHVAVEADWSAVPPVDGTWLDAVAEHRDELLALLNAAAGK